MEFNESFPLEKKSGLWNVLGLVEAMMLEMVYKLWGR